MGSLVGVGSALGAFFDGEDRELRPSHDEITNAFKQYNLTGWTVPAVADSS